MAGLEGTISTPLGAVKKKTALYGAGVVAVLGGIVWYRHKQTAAATPVATDGEIDPATGYAYGSPEDAAALASQSSYVTPVTNTASAGGSSSIPSSNVGYSSNGQWVQAVVEYMTSNGLVQDGSTLSAALGKYVTGSYVASGSAEDSLIAQAIAVQGYPPVAGSTGYPPSINRNAPVGSTTGATPAAVSGLRASTVTANRIGLTWNGALNARGYDITWTDAQGRVGNATSLLPGYTMSNLPKSERYMIKVRAKHDVAPLGGTTDGPWTSAIQVTTHAK